jgi:hypothetical protein
MICHARLEGLFSASIYYQTGIDTILYTHKALKFPPLHVWRGP